MPTDVVTAPRRSRRPRFARPAQPPAMQVTERDVALMADHAKHRFLRTDQVIALYPDASPKKIIERIGVLEANGYLHRPPAQVEYFRAGGGSSPIVHAIGDRGARLLAERANIEPGRLAWSRKNDKATRVFIHHTVEVASVSIALIVACRRRADLTLQEQSALIAAMPAATRDSQAPLKLKARIANGGEPIQAGVIPDLAFALKFSDGSGFRAFVVEVDRGKMPVERGHLHQTSIIKKCLVYEIARRQHVVERQFGWKAFRVLIVTNTPERAANIRAAILRTDAIKSSPLFLITDTQSLDDVPDILEFPWMAADGTTHRLVP